MRYYKITITDKDGKPILDAAGNPIGPWDTSKSFGRGLHVTFDIQTLGAGMHLDGVTLSVYGLPVDVLRRAVNLSGARIEVSAGFDKANGLPLAKEQPDPGVILSGRVHYAFGNWEGVNQSLNMVVYSHAWNDSTGKAQNIILDGKRGDKLSLVLQNALETSYPNSPVTIVIRDSLILTEDWKSPYFNLDELAEMLRQNTPGLSGDSAYSGASLVVQKDGIYITDDSYVDAQPEAMQEFRNIKAQDFIGQPTWINFNTMVFKTPLRADLKVFDVLIMPEGLSNSPLTVGSQRGRKSEKDRSSFTGRFQISAIRHIGEYCNQSGDAWVTVIQAFEIRRMANNE